MLRRKGRNSDIGLPTVAHSNIHGGGSSIHMDAPVVKAVKNASIFTRMSYFFLLFSVCITIFGIRHWKNNDASIVLNCGDVYCTLSIKDIGSRCFDALLHRDQIVRSNQIYMNSRREITGFITKDGENENYLSQFDHHHKSKDDKNYSYTIVLQPYDNNSMSTRNNNLSGNDDSLNFSSKEVSVADLEENFYNLRQFIALSKGDTYLKETNEIQITMKKHFRDTRRGRIRSQHSRIKRYMEGKRTKVTLRESKGPSWIGILSIIFGLFSAILTVLVGQFWDENDHSYKRKKRLSNNNAASSVRIGQRNKMS